MHKSRSSLIKVGVVVCLFAGSLTALIFQENRLLELNSKLSELTSDIEALKVEAREVQLLRRENEQVQRLRNENEEVQRLRRDNTDLYRLRNESHLFKEQKVELERLRAENERLRAELRRKADLLSRTSGGENKEPKEVESLALYTRFFKVDPTAFYEAISNSNPEVSNYISAPIQDFFTDGVTKRNPETGGGGLHFVTRQSQVGIVGASVHAFFAAIGVDLSPPKNLFYKDRQGMLMVRATLQDLDTVEQALAKLKTVSPQQP